MLCWAKPPIKGRARSAPISASPRGHRDELTTAGHALWAKARVEQRAYSGHEGGAPGQENAVDCVLCDVGGGQRLGDGGVQPL